MRVRDAVGGPPLSADAVHALLTDEGSRTAALCALEAAPAIEVAVRLAAAPALV